MNPDADMGSHHVIPRTENSNTGIPHGGKLAGSRGKTGKPKALEWVAPSWASIALKDEVIRP